MLDFRVTHTAPRRLHLQLRINRPAHMHAQLLTKQGRLLERRAFHAAEGRTTHGFHIPNGVPPGLYRLRLTLQANESGAQRSLEREVTITDGQKMPHARTDSSQPETLADNP